MMDRFEKYISIKKLSPYAFKHKKVFIKSIIAGVFNSLFTLTSLLLGAYLTALAFSGSSPNEISRYFPLLLGLIIGKGITAYLHMLLCHDVAYLVLENLRGDMFDAIEFASPLNPVKYRTGEVSSIIMEDVETLETFFAHMLGDYIIAIICMILYILLYLILSWQAALLSLMAGIIIITIPYWFGSINQKLGKESREKLGKTNASVVDTVQGLKEIIIFGKESKYIQKVVDDTKKLGKIDTKDGFMKGLQAGIINFVMSVVLISVLILGNKMVIRGQLNPNYIGILVMMALNIFIPVVTVSSTAGKINMVAASADRINALLNEQPMIFNIQNTNSKIINNDLLFVKDVSFSYENKKEVLKDFNLSVKPLENIAITGKSGAGKSTLINLLMRFYDPLKGDIFLNGRNYKNMTAQEVRKNIAYVPQDVYLFHGTLIDNLRIGKPDASFEEVEKACKIAVADEFIKQLDDGYNSFVGERGITLSGGQKQRIAIARALIVGAPILIMDEAVSNLDTKSEELFRQALKNISNEKTIITIAHRMSTILEADRVVVIENGLKAFDGKLEDWRRL